MKLVCISDTHNKHKYMPEIPDGDVLIFAGDMSMTGKKNDIKVFNDFLGTLPHKHKLVIAGNHDWYCYKKESSTDGYYYNKENAQNLLTNCTYLQDDSVTINGIKFYGSPWQPEFCNWAFNVERGSKIKEKWDLIPIDTDVLITHGPPHNILDEVPRGELVGCEDLLDKVCAVRPKVHVFGHIHCAYGVKVFNETVFINASTCNEMYQPVNKPIVWGV